MKKKIIAGLALTLLTSFGGLSAEGNSYADVPQNHWVYAEIDALVQDKLIVGYDAAVYDKNKVATRYEMARFLANALSKYEQADTQQKTKIDRLAQEFAVELNTLGVRTAQTKQYLPQEPVQPAKETKAKKTSVTIDGETLIEAMDVDSVEHAGSEAYNWRQRLHINADFNDRVSYKSRIQAGGKFGSGNSSNEMRFTRSFIQVKDFFGVNQFQAGRLPLATGRYMAMALQGDADGFALRHQFDKTRLDGYWVVPEKDTHVRGVNLNFAPEKSFEYNIGYIAADTSPKTSTPAANYVDAGLSWEMKKGVTSVLNYTKSDAPGSPNAWAAQLSYNWVSGKRQTGFYTYEGLVNNRVPHDQAIAIIYRDIEKNALPGHYGNFGGFGKVDQNGHKGFMLGYQNMVMDGIRLSLQYQNLEEKTTGDRDHRYYGAFDMYFN
ncbi:hypothetical protein [Sporomusa sphaeroides]|uniref:SLH domain-containing protein n=1 Tax=Sporomusa sphaeroides DSM 2875 TaxID=1337886 RepID=A0ABM9W150_9FIRM|nr:hypothetical protein [Sporomusa sphaeroides]OLS55898.1 hypothetical protein SPSPH_32280 [Sporomusa sphaeroides DSM 2875]CVK18899.1 hypothetical protein SSPH_01543 [Sporomusa sphaeroides DSM 2875]